MTPEPSRPRPANRPPPKKRTSALNSAAVRDRYDRMIQYESKETISSSPVIIMHQYL